MRRRVWNVLRSVPAYIDYHTNFSHWLPQSNDVILTYHSVGEPIGKPWVSTERFRRDLEFLTRRYEVVPLSGIGSESRTKQVALTFDDGYRNFHDAVYPLLQEYDVPATVFVISELIETTDCDLINLCLNIDISDPDVMLGAPEIEELVRSDLVTIGNHTRTHPNLENSTQCTRSFKDEIVGAKAHLEDRFDITVEEFSYPYGSYDPGVVQSVRESHRLAVTTEHGIADPETDAYRLPRVGAHKSEPLVRWETTDFGNWLWENPIVQRARK